MARARIPVALLSVLALAGAIPEPALVDPSLAEQWGLHTIGAPAAWPTATGKGVVVAVVDTGVDLDHEDLAGKIVANVSCIGAAGDPSRCGGSGQDDHGHGTHVAGIVAAATNNGRGVAAVAPEARIMAVKVLAPGAGGKASGKASDVVAGIRWAVDHGAHVVNVSIEDDPNRAGEGEADLRDAVNEAWDRGVIPVVPAGNHAASTGYGGLNAIVVTATTRGDGHAPYASDIAGARWGLAAPGGDGTGSGEEIYSTWWRPGSASAYQFEHGTSMAAPHVAGAAAALRSLGLSPHQVVSRLIGTAVDLGVTGPDGDFGWGRLDMAAAVDGLGPDAGAQQTARAPRTSGGGARGVGTPSTPAASPDQPDPATTPPADGSEPAPAPTPGGGSGSSTDDRPAGSETPRGDGAAAAASRRAQPEPSRTGWLAAAALSFGLAAGALVRRMVRRGAAVP